MIKLKFMNKAHEENMFKLTKMKPNLYNIKDLSKNYLRASSNLSNIQLKNLNIIYTNKKYTKKILNLNHNGALLPKKENQKEFFNIFSKFKKILIKKIPKNSLLHFPIIVRLNNTLSNKRKPYSATHPHIDSWAGQPENSQILSYNVVSLKNSPNLEILQLKKNKKISLKKKKSYLSTIRPYEVKSIYKTRSNDLSILEPGTLHRTSRGNQFRITLECRFIKKDKLKKTDPKNLKNFYYPFKKFFKINNKNTKILTEYGKFAKSRSGVDFETSLN